MISFREIQDALLAELYVRTMSGKRNDYIEAGTFDTPSLELNLGVEPKILKKAAVDLKTDGFLEAAEEVHAGALEISGKGIKHVEVMVESGVEPFVSRLNAARGAAISEALEDAEVEVLEGSQIPASDRMVRINHNSPEYAQVVATLDDVIKEFRDDHRLDNELGHEKGALLKALEGGRELLNDVVINARVTTALILEPLRRLAEKYDQALVGALASAAIPLVLKLLGIVG